MVNAMDYNIGFMEVSLDVYMPYMGYTGEELSVGDSITVYFDGVITDDYPAQVNSVYFIYLLE